jgi:hypothetical protein
MSSTPSIVRELVDHLRRAQRALDAGQFEDAERAIAEVVAIDPGNVHASDLQNRVLTARGATAAHRRPSRAKRASAEWPLGPGAKTDREASGAPPGTHSAAGEVAPAAWSEFERRVRARRADRAVAGAHAAIARGDRGAAGAALAELDVVSPDDTRRNQIAGYLELLPIAPRQPQWPPEPPAVLAPGPAASERDDDVADIELVRPLYMTEGVVDTHPFSLSVPAERRGGARVRTVFAAAGVLVGAVLLGWTLTRTSFVAPTPVSEARHRAEDAVDPAGAAVPVPPDVLEDPLDKATPDPTLLTPSGNTPTNEPSEAGARASSAPVPAAPADGAVQRPTERETNLTPSGTAMSEARPPEAPSEPPFPADPTPAPPPALALESPVQALGTPAVTRPADGQLEQPSRGVAPVSLLSAADPAAAPAPPATALASPVDADASAVRGVLDGYASAYNALDAEATQRVWPGVDLRGLRRAFEQLSAQTVKFDRCDVSASADQAEAVCVGRTTWVPRVGDQTPRSEARTWQFALNRDGNDWLIERVQVKR